MPENKQTSKHTYITYKHQDRRIFKNLKVVYKILIPILVFSVFAIAVNSFASLILSKIRKSLDTMYEKGYILASETSQLKANMYSLMNTLMRMGMEMAEGVNIAEIYRDSIEQTMSFIEDSIKIIKEKAETQEEKELISGIESEYYEFKKKIQEDILAYAENGQKEKFLSELQSIAPLYDGIILKAEQISNNVTEKLRQILEHEIKSGQKNHIIFLYVSMFSIPLAIVFAILIGYVFLAKPMQLIAKFPQNVFKKSGEIDLTTKLSFTGKDEIGEISDAINKFVAGIEDFVNRLVSILGSTVELAEKLSSLKQNLITVHNEQSSIQSILSSSAEELSQVSKDMARTAESITRGTKEEKKKVENSIIKIKESINKISNIVDILKVIKETFEGLRTSVDKINKVVGTIEDISEQINLLSLNASIEASRAGDAGKGFAVVAAEIRRLADRTRTIVKDIKSMAEKNVKVIDDTKKVIEKANQFSQEAIESVNISSDQLDKINIFLENIIKNIDSFRLSAHQQEKSSLQVAEIALNLTKILETLDQNIKGISEEIDMLQRTAAETKSFINKFKLKKT
jgi:Methyl-accepting chemotaxis protein